MQTITILLFRCVKICQHSYISLQNIIYAFTLTKQYICTSIYLQYQRKYRSNFWILQQGYIYGFEYMLEFSVEEKSSSSNTIVKLTGILWRWSHVMSAIFVFNMIWMNKSLNEMDVLSFLLLLGHDVKVLVDWY